MSCLLLTPRFRTSRHVVFLVLPEGSSTPVLVAKAPRLRDDRVAIERESATLRAAQEARPGGFDTIPRVVSLEDVHGWPLLVETALAGRPMSPAAVRRHPERCIGAVLDWLAELPSIACVARDGEEGWYERLLADPLSRFATRLPADGEEVRLVERTLEVLEPLRGAEVPLVLEHGDLSHPNLLVLESGRLGVLDWELAELRGVPLADLCFFLAYAAFARRRAHTLDRQLQAFDEAFVRPGAWAGRIVAEEADRLGVPRRLAGLLFVACWPRYVLRLAERVEGEAGGPGLLDADTAAWLRGNRYSALWRHSLANACALEWAGGA